MAGNGNGFLTLLKNGFPNLIGIFCIAHCKTPVASNASKRILSFLYVETLGNKVGIYVQNSTKKNNEIIILLEVMKLESLQVLHIHRI